MVNAIHKLGFLESFMKENFMFYCLLKPEMMIYGTFELNNSYSKNYL